jgi:hypothetical protein
MAIVLLLALMSERNQAAPQNAYSVQPAQYQTAPPAFMQRERMREWRRGQRMQGRR